MRVSMQILEKIVECRVGACKFTSCNLTEPIQYDFLCLFEFMRNPNCTIDNFVQNGRTRYSLHWRKLV